MVRFNSSVNAASLLKPLKRRNETSPAFLARNAPMNLESTKAAIKVATKVHGQNEPDSSVPALDHAVIKSKKRQDPTTSSVVNGVPPAYKRA